MTPTISKKKRFLDQFDNPNNIGVDVYIQMPGAPALETIWNPEANFKYKKDYYDKTYDEDLNHKHVPKLHITHWEFYPKPEGSR